MGELQFLETDRFARWVRKNRLGGDVERLKGELSADPESGAVVPATGGLRKVRMAGHGRGKRGGFRVIYVLMVDRAVAVLLRGYSKSDQEDLSPDELAETIVLAGHTRPLAEQLARDAAENQPEGE